MGRIIISIKMNKKIIFAFVVVSLVLIAGCSGGKKEDERPITDVDIRKGEDGLEMGFLSNAPPGNVFEDSPFPIAVELRNTGACHINSETGECTTEKKGIIVFGFEEAYVAAETSGKEWQEFGINGKSIFNPKGDVEFITIDAQTKKISAQSETHPSTIFATACYPYKTIFGSSVCIDPDIYGMGKGQKACDIKEMAFPQGQGAPVAVTKIETRMLPENDETIVKPHFFIFIENKGNGEVVNLSKVEKACTNEPLEYTDFNSMQINVTLSGKLLDCSVDTGGAKIETIRLRDKKDLVRCTLEEGIDLGRDAYTAPLRIELQYGYTFTISKDIIIEKILKY